MASVDIEAEPGDLYVYLARDGGIFVAPGDDLRRSAWVTLAGLEHRLARMAPDARVWLSEQGDGPLARDAAASVRSAERQVTEAVPLPETRRAEGVTALMSAAYVGAVDLVDDLVARGAPVDARDDKGYTALMFAAEQGQREIVTRLLDAGADLEAVDADGTTPLMFAAWSGHPETVRCLLEAGADPTRTRPRPGGPPGEMIDAVGLALGRGHAEAAAALGWGSDPGSVTFPLGISWWFPTIFTLGIAVFIGGVLALGATEHPLHWYDPLIGLLFTAFVGGLIFGFTALRRRSFIRFDGWTVTVRPLFGRTWSFDARRVAEIRRGNNKGGPYYRIRLRDDAGGRGQRRYVATFRTERITDELLARVSRVPDVKADKRTAARLAAMSPGGARQDDGADRR